MSNVRRITTAYIILAVVLFAVIVLCILSGSVPISILEAFDSQSMSASILLDIRIPRVLAAVFAGGALSVAGYCLQTFFHNPVAGPYLLGISSGAKLSVAILLIFLSGGVSVTSSVSMIGISFIGAMLAMGFVLIISKHVGNMSMLLVCGVMIGYICTAACDFLVTFAQDSDIVNLHNWSKGSLGGISLSQAIVMAAAVIIGVICAGFLSKPMSAFLVSENYAASLGVNIPLFKIELVMISSFLSACVTAFAGPISFVGIAVPHIVRKVFDTAKPRALLPACFMSGAVFTCLCDLIARKMFAPTELSISTVTAIIGSPIVIYMLINRNRT